MNFTTIAQLGYTISFMPLNLSVFFFYAFSSITLSPSVFFSFAWLCWHLQSSVFERKKDKRFFSLPVVLSLTHFSPRPVSCVFSPISGILRSPPSMWVTLMCAAGLSCRASSSPLCNLGVRCVLVCLDYELCVCVCVCVCVFIFVCAVPVIHSVWILMKDHNPIITTARDVCPNVSWFLYLFVCVCVMFSKSYYNHKAWGLFPLMIAYKSNISTYYHKTNS